MEICKAVTGEMLFGYDENARKEKLLEVNKMLQE